MVACLIGANFLTNIVEKEFDPKGLKYPEVFSAFALLYNVCFTLELVINMYAHWFREFWRSNWNIFDVVVVVIGIVMSLNLPLPPAFALLRMMRAFRVFRLFKRVHSLNKIIVAIVHAVPGVANAFLILFIVMSIYAILAVEFYKEAADDCNTPGGDIRFRTTRGFCYGSEYFGTFGKSLFSFFQVLTGESWSEMVARPAMWFWYDDPLRAIGGGIFFVTYFLISAFVLTNVVVAVLLDKMVDPEVADATHERMGINPEDKYEEQTEEKSNMPETTEELDASLASVGAEVEKMAQFSETMSSEMDNLRSTMAAMKEQVASMLQTVPGATINNNDK